jgi:hypothetical protein
MRIDRARRKLELAADREAEKLARAQDKARRGMRNYETGTRQADEAKRRIMYFQERKRELDASELAAEACP